MDVGDVLQRVNMEFQGWPRGSRAVLLGVAGLVLMGLAVPSFRRDFLMGLVYVMLAAVLFWLAIYPYI